MKTDIQIQKDIMDQLRWEPFLNASQIGVAVKNGIVALSGTVDSYGKKIAAENAARKISGVKAIAEEIRVGLSPSFKKTDAEIAEAVYNALKWHTAIPEDKIKIKVENGNVWLDGEVEWEYQRDNAKSVIQYLAGVHSVINQVKITPKVTASNVQQKINAAFQRSATIDAGKIKADVAGNRVTLNGKVRSLVEKEDAENAAWNAPGVLSVINNLEIEVPEFAFED